MIEEMQCRIQSKESEIEGIKQKEAKVTQKEKQQVATLAQKTQGLADKIQLGIVSATASSSLGGKKPSQKRLI